MYYKNQLLQLPLLLLLLLLLINLNQTLINASENEAPPAPIEHQNAAQVVAAPRDLASMVASMGSSPSAIKSLDYTETNINTDDDDGTEEQQQLQDTTSRENEQDGEFYDYESVKQRRRIHNNNNNNNNNKRFKKNNNEEKFDWDMYLDKDANYKLDWRIQESSRDEPTRSLSLNNNKIIFKLSLNGTKFRLGRDVFALGFSERGEMASSDFCLLWYDLSHKLHLQTARTNNQNILNLEGGRSICKLVHSEELSFVQRADDDGDNGDNNDDRVEALDSVDKNGSPTLPNHLEVIFKRPLVPTCLPDKTANARRHHELSGNNCYYIIDRGTTHLVWFKLSGPIIVLDGMNLTEALGGRSDSEQQHQRQQIMATVSSSSSSSSSPINHDHASSTSGHLSSSSSEAAAGEFGLKRIQLIASKLPISNEHKRHRSAAAASTTTMVHDVRMNNYTIPSRETTYWCKLFKLPERFAGRRYHITSYEAVIEPLSTNEHIVHHMELFNCANLSPKQAKQLDDLYANQSGWSGECSSPARPRATDPCRRVILAWAMGAKPLVYPPEVGQSIGGPGYGQYVVLEVHYNNVGKESNLRDSSGLRFHYSSRLRPFDAGVLEVGLEYTDKNSIPPNMVAPLAGHCVGECLRVAMSGGSGGPSTSTSSLAGAKHFKHNINNKHRMHNNDNQQGIYVFAAQMHTHLTGVASWTEHTRGGRLLAELQRDNHYSPHFQEIRLFPKPVHVLPGDALIHYCLYDTRQRENITLGGFATSDEMCVTYLHYYPRIDLEVCKSSVDSKALRDYFRQLASEEESPGGGGGAGHSATAANGSSSVSENYHSIKWSRRRSRELLDFYSEAPLSIQCNRSNGERWPGHWEGQPQTKLFWLPDGSSSSGNGESWRRQMSSSSSSSSSTNIRLSLAESPPPLIWSQINAADTEEAKFCSQKRWHPSLVQWAGSSNGVPANAECRTADYRGLEVASATAE